MPNGSKADTNTLWLKKQYDRGFVVMSPSGPLSLPQAITIMHDYYVYEFLFNGKVFYVGNTYHHVRSHGRWGHVSNLLKHEKRGTLKPAKKTNLNTRSNRVIAALIDADLQRHYSVSVCRPCLEEQANDEERAQIKKRLSENCVLANVDDLPNDTKPSTIDEVLRYLGVTPGLTPNRVVRIDSDFR